MKLYAEKCTRSSFILHTEDGAQAVYHKTGCTGDKKRLWYTNDREPFCLASLDRKEKQRILDFLFRSPADMAICVKEPRKIEPMPETEKNIKNLVELKVDKKTLDVIKIYKYKGRLYRYVNEVFDCILTGNIPSIELASK